MDFKVVNKGIDSLYLSFTADLRDDFLQQLDEKKELAQSEHIADKAKAVIEIADHLFEVIGKGRGKFKYVLKDNWYQIQISGEKAQSVPDIYVQVSSELLNCFGLPQSIEKLQKIVSSITTSIEKEVPSRIDLFIDFIVDKDLGAIDKKSWITRAIKKTNHSEHDVHTGWSIGQGGDISLRSYNKSLEIKKSNKEFFEEIWANNGWTEEDKVWRIEFQLRRNFLKQMTIHTMDEFLLSINDVWRYCTEKWVRLAIDDDTVNQSRWETEPFWEQVQNVKFEDGNFTGIMRYVDKSRLPLDRVLFLNGMGYIISYAVKNNIKNIHEAIFRYLIDALKYHDRKAIKSNLFKNGMEYVNSKMDYKRKIFNKPSVSDDEDI